MWIRLMEFRSTKCLCFEPLVRQALAALSTDQVELSYIRVFLDLSSVADSR